MNQEKQTGGLRCHDPAECVMGQLPCPTPKACNCAPPAVQPSRECLQQSAGSTVYPPLPMSKACHAVDGQSACWDAEEMRAYVDADRAAYVAASATTTPAENLRCKSVQKRLATMWGYVPALEAAPPEPADVAVPTESVLIDGIAYEVPAAVAGELLRLHLDLLAAAPAPKDQQP